MLILGIETSCDETAAAVVEDGRRILSNVIASQIELHARYGGIVPEVASRQHVLALVPALGQALADARCSLSDIGAVAVTYGPGLAGALMVGVNAAKALALALERPLLGIHHLEGHIYAAWLAFPDPGLDPGFPLVCLIASGGHTDLFLMEEHGRYRNLGHTRDDAAGEAFDKAARVLGLGFPGGPAIQRVAEGVRPGEPLPRAWLGKSLDFSFSGLKTALLHRAQAEGIYPASQDGAVNAQVVAPVAAAFQEAVVDVLASKTVRAAQAHGAKGILLGGGVAANTRLRQVVRERSPMPVLVPPPSLCTDNGAMIAAAAFFRLARGERHGPELDAVPTLPLA